MNTSSGTRIIDQVVVSGQDIIANESKVGYTSLTYDINLQVAKDSELLQSGQVTEVIWHFYQSPVTGEIGASQPLLDLLDQKGIKYLIEINY